MTRKQQKDEWKKESDQLKKDLANRQKIIQKREVELSFGKKKLKNESKNKIEGDSKDDNYFRQSINWSDC